MNYGIIFLSSMFSVDPKLTTRSTVSVFRKLLIHDKISKRGLKQFINRQRLAIAHNCPLKDALLILDDCFDHPSILDNDITGYICPWHGALVRCECCINEDGT